MPLSMINSSTRNLRNYNITIYHLEIKPVLGGLKEHFCCFSTADSVFELWETKLFIQRKNKVRFPWPDKCLVEHNVAWLRGCDAQFSVHLQLRSEQPSGQCPRSHLAVTRHVGIPVDAPQNEVHRRLESH